MKTRILALGLLLALSACGKSQPDLDMLAQEYLFLELSMGLHDKAHVDAYFGPEELRAAATENALSLDQLLTASADLTERLESIDASGDAMLQMRVDGLVARLRALDTRIAINKRDYLSFDDEALALFGSQAPFLAGVGIVLVSLVLTQFMRTPTERVVVPVTAGD